MVAGLSGLVEKALEVVVEADNKVKDLVDVAGALLDQVEFKSSILAGTAEAFLSNLRDEVEDSPYDDVKAEAKTRDEKIDWIVNHVGGDKVTRDFISERPDSFVDEAYDEFKKEAESRGK